MKKNIIFFIMGFALAIGISAYALSINARDTAYDNTNSGSSATNMQDAIDDLYERSGNATLIDCGTYGTSPGSPGESRTVNVYEYYDGDLSVLTADNFILEVDKYHYWGGIGSGAASASTSPGKVYDSTTGVLTVTNISASVGARDRGMGQGSITFKVWLVPNDFRN